MDCIAETAKGPCLALKPNDIQHDVCRFESREVPAAFLKQCFYIRISESSKAFVRKGYRM